MVDWFGRAILVNRSRAEASREQRRNRIEMGTGSSRSSTVARAGSSRQTGAGGGGPTYVSPTVSSDEQTRRRPAALVFLHKRKRQSESARRVIAFGKSNLFNILSVVTHD